MGGVLQHPLQVGEGGGEAPPCRVCGEEVTGERVEGHFAHRHPREAFAAAVKVEGEEQNRKIPSIIDIEDFLGSSSEDDRMAGIPSVRPRVAELVVLGQEGRDLVRVEGAVGEVVMEGATGAVMEAVEEESKAAIKETNKTANNTKDPDMFLYNDEVNVLLCGGGKVLKVVEKMTDTSIKVLGEKGEVRRPVIISGSEEGKKKAKEIIKIALIPDFSLNNDEAGWLLREGGKTVAKVMKETNTVITILGSYGQGRNRQRGVRVLGSEEEKEMAKDMILKIL